MNEPDIDVREQGKSILDDPTLSGFTRQGRLLTNMEMYAVSAWCRDREWQAKLLLEEL